MLRDSACEGWLVHRRTAATQHAFRYPLWMLYVDVDRLASYQSLWFSSTARPAPLAVRAGDYPVPSANESASAKSADANVGAISRSRFRDGRPPSIRAAVNQRLRLEGLEPADRVFLLTQPRSWGWQFNPVSFYFCFRDAALCSVLAEINNTPWDEVHTYVLDTTGKGGVLEFEFPKRFHVSPFMPMDVSYRWRFRLEPDSLEVAMRLLRDGAEVFFAGLYLRPRPLDRAALRRAAFRYPLQSLRTLARIYWQAFRLWGKGTPVYTHPGKLKEITPT